MEESETRLTLFAERVTARGLADNRQLKLKESREALEDFIKLNMYILNVKKVGPLNGVSSYPANILQFQTANSEATRKILKKHAKRTALALPDSTAGHERMTLILHAKSVSLPRILVQAIGEILLPVIPHLDDYSCLICTGIAFKPIRLNCGHLFCVRCLVKMQKRGQGDCPMCRSPTVLRADKCTFFSLFLQSSGRVANEVAQPTLIGRCSTLCRIGFRTRRGRSSSRMRKRLRRRS